MISSIYLTGNTFNSSALQGLNIEPDWRTLAVTKLQRHGLKVVNPIEWALTGPDEELNIERRVRRALDLIDQCDVLLANLQTPSYGTAMELFYAHRHGKMVTVVGQSPYSPWILLHSQARFENIEHALDFLIGENPKPDIYHWAIQYESLLSQRYEQLPPAGEADYQFNGGELPILVISPHATAYFREGKFQEVETFTGSLAACLQKASNCHALTSTYCSVADPCWHIETPMVRTIADIVKVANIQLVIMLLGTPMHDTPGLLVNTYGPEDSSFLDYGNHLKQALAPLEPPAEDMSNEIVKPLVDYLAYGLKVPTIVLRTHKHYRMPRLQPETFLRLLQVLSRFINERGLEFLRSM
jgi:hypothetical protein